MITVYLTHGQSNRDITELLTSWTWSGDKATISRQLSGEIVFLDTDDLPVPELGDRITMVDGLDQIFSGTVLRREVNSEASTMDFTAFDDGYYLGRNDGTYKFTGATPEAITRQICADQEIPVAELPVTLAALNRKFAAVPLKDILTTVWTLASERTGYNYALRYTPKGLLVKVRSESDRSLVIQARSNLMDATTKEDATQMVNRVAIFDKNGNFLRRLGDEDAQALYGVMEKHVTESDDAGEADNAARKALDDGRLAQNITVNLLGDLRLITGETVYVRDAKTGLNGIFWVDADQHTWKNKNYYCKLTLNVRNVMNKATAGQEVS